MPTTYGKVQVLSLPSANKVRVRRVSLLSMVRSNQLPPTLISAVWAVFGTGDGAKVDEAERVKTMVALMDASVKAVLVDLKVTEDGVSDTHIDEQGCTVGTVNLDDMPDSDKNLLFAYAQGTADGKDEEVLKDLTSFRRESAGEASGSGSAAVRSQTESPDRPQGQEARPGV